MVGTGPFILDRHVRGQEVRYRRNPGGPLGPGERRPTRGPPTWRRSPTGSSPRGAVRVGALTSGQVQVIEGVPATDIASIENDPELTLQTALNSGSAFSYYFNTSRPSSTTSGYGRPSARRSTSTPCSSRSYRGTATRAWSIVARSSPFYDPSLEGAFGGDAAKANALLDAAGWTGRDAEGYRVKDGERLTVRLVQSAPYVRDRRDVLAQAIQAQVKRRARHRPADPARRPGHRPGGVRPATSTSSSRTPAATPTPAPRST